MIGAVISHNTVHRVPYGYGIYFGGGNTASSDAVITDNIIDGAFDFGIHVDSRGAGATRTQNVTIARNNITGCSPNGLLLRHVADIRVMGNTIWSSGVLDGIGVAPACLGCVLKRNTVGGPPAPASIWSHSVNT